VCQLKTLVGSQPLVRYDAKHCRCMIINTLDEDVIVDIKHIRHSTTHKRILKDVELATTYIWQGKVEEAKVRV
jgi:hypothetical protein